MVNCTDAFVHRRPIEETITAAFRWWIFPCLILGLAAVFSPCGFAQESLAATGYQPNLDIMLVLDNSGSMLRNDPDRLTIEVVTSFLEGLDSGSRLGLIIFDEEVKLAVELTPVTDPTARERLLQGLEAVDYKGSWTHSPKAVESAIYKLKEGREEATRVIIFLTDGKVDYEDPVLEGKRETWLKTDLADDASKNGIRIFAVAFTEEADFSLIQTLANKTNGEYFRAFVASDIAGVFDKINDRISLPPPSTPTPFPTPTPVPTAPPPTNPPTKTGLEKLKEWPMVLVVAVVAIAVVVIIGLLLGRRGSADGKEPRRPAIELWDMRDAELEPIKVRRMPFSVGRHPRNDLLIPEDTVSADHAIIEFRHGSFLLEDRHSSNGTFLNGKLVPPNNPVRLKHGDRIRFDLFEFKFTLAEQETVGSTVVGAQDGPGTLTRSPSSDLFYGTESTPLGTMPDQSTESDGDDDDELSSATSLRIPTTGPCDPP